MGRPGETLLVVLADPEGAAQDAGSGRAGGAGRPRPWYDTLWSSVQAATPSDRTVSHRAPHER